MSVGCRGRLAKESFVTNGPKLAATEGYRGGQQPVSPSSARSSKLNADPLLRNGVSRIIWPRAVVS